MNRKYSRIIIIPAARTWQVLHYYDGIGGCNGVTMITTTHDTLIYLSSEKEEDNTV